MKIITLSFTRSLTLFLILFASGAAFAQETESAPEAAEEQADEQTDETETTGDAETPREPVERTSLALPAYAPFGESQRAMPPVVNPAHPSLSDRRFRFGTLFDFGFGVEVGEADDFDREIDDILDTFDRLEAQAENFEGPPPPSDAEIQEFLDDVNLFEDQANTLVRDLTDRAYAKLTASASAPLVPIAVRSDSLGGTFTLNADGFLEARAAVESTGDAFAFGLAGVQADDVDRFETDPDGIPVVVLDDNSRHRIEPTDDAGVAVQGGTVGRVGAGYAREAWTTDAGNLHAGFTFNFFHTTLVRGGVLLNDDELEDTARDEFEDNQETSTGFGLDFGAAWVAKRYSLGGVIRNINEPSFDYPDTGDSAFFQANPQARRNGSRWTMDRQFTLQGALHTTDRRWILSGAFDLNSATDTTGDDYQWAGLMGSFEPRRTWVPSPRVGIRRNLTGEELTYVSAGVSFFRALHLDISSTLDTTSLDGTETPRGLQANIALGRRF